MTDATHTLESTVANPAKNSRRRRAARLTVGALAVPALLVAFSGTAGAAELTPIAEYLDETIAATSEGLVGALALLLGVA
ncbi:hypothetical protein EV191_10279 [Tamaricihabitans halophyticus]|uniref:Uncharacterized protein n=1 Tax=Tamaricihabitans halophyticus TaxID=1262583 RepID=A0A4R2QXF9_9PSEU|nr:hypothetical protein [Tamaricihabitans halophyticus]TCP54870.1 hypothetical protein EV191_10279 [Tamaricihabitans halophyticus]